MIYRFFFDVLGGLWGVKNGDGCFVGGFSVQNVFPLWYPRRPHPTPCSPPRPLCGRPQHGVGWGGVISLFTLISMNIDIHIIINMNIEYYIDYYTLLMPNFTQNLNKSMKLTIHKWVWSVMTVPNPAQYTRSGKYIVKNQHRN